MIERIFVRLDCAFLGDSHEGRGGLISFLNWLNFTGNLDACDIVVILFIIEMISNVL